jgi:hypothetical protein
VQVDITFLEPLYFRWIAPLDNSIKTTHRY